MGAAERAGFRVLDSRSTDWGANPVGVRFLDLARSLGLEGVGARLWRLSPGQASVRHRHFEETEVYLALEGDGALWVDGQIVRVAAGVAVAVEPFAARQLFNDTTDEHLWIAIGAPSDIAREMTDEARAYRFPDGFDAVPPSVGRRPG